MVINRYEERVHGPVKYMRVLPLERKRKLMQRVEER